MKPDKVSPGSIGGKIKKIREYRGLTQKQLGMLCGFSEMTAQVRIGQYENNSRIPNESVLKALTDALGIDEYSFYETDLIKEDKAIHTLFDIEDLHGLRPVKINGHVYLDFSGKTIFGTETNYYSHHDFLDKWYEMLEKNTVTPTDSKEDALQKRKEYDLWRYEYPLNEAKVENTELDLLLLKKERLEKELRETKSEIEKYE